MNDSHGDSRQSLAHALRQIDPNQPLGTDLYNAIARLSINVAIEAVCLHATGSSLQILLSRRAPDDTAYPGMWHCPGTIMRPGESIEKMFKRLAGSDFPGRIRAYQFVTFDNNPHEARGHFLHLIFLVTPEDVTKGEWFPVDELPQETIEHHRRVVIPATVTFFNEHKPS